MDRREKITLFIQIALTAYILGILVHYLYQFIILSTGAWMIIYENNIYILYFEIAWTLFLILYMLYEIKQKFRRLFDA